MTGAMPGFGRGARRVGLACRDLGTLIVWARVERARRGLHSAPRPSSMLEGPLLAHFPRHVADGIKKSDRQFESGRHSRTARRMDVPWWEATAASVVRGSRPDATDAGETSAAGSFGCDVRGAGGHRRRGGTPSSQLIGATGSAPSFAADASALRAFVASSPRLCVNISATWCAPCVRFHPKFADMSAAFPDVLFITVDIDRLDDDVLDGLDVETIPTFLLMRGGREVTRVVGVAHKRPARPLAAAIRRHLCS